MERGQYVKRVRTNGGAVNGFPLGCVCLVANVSYYEDDDENEQLESFNVKRLGATQGWWFDAGEAEEDWEECEVRQSEFYVIEYCGNMVSQNNPERYVAKTVEDYNRMLGVIRGVNYRILATKKIKYMVEVQADD